MYFLITYLLNFGMAEKRGNNNSRFTLQRSTLQRSKILRSTLQGFALSLVERQTGFLPRTLKGDKTQTKELGLW